MQAVQVQKPSLTFTLVKLLASLVVVAVLISFFPINPTAAFLSAVFIGLAWLVRNRTFWGARALMWIFILTAVYMALIGMLATPATMTHPIVHNPNNPAHLIQG